MSIRLANPKVIEAIRSLDVDSDVADRLAYHLKRTEMGSNEVYRTPLAKELDPNVILSNWDSIFQTNKYKINSTLSTLEELNRDKFGPRSIMKPWAERKDSLYESYDIETFKRYPNMPPHSEFVSALRGLSFNTALTYLKNNTNSGLPYYTRKSKVKDRLLSELDELLERDDPCILFTRTQEGNKTRNVWGYPIAITLLEMTIYPALLAYQKRVPWRQALNTPEDVNLAMTKLILKAQSNPGYWTLVSIDFSAFDATVGLALIETAFNYIKFLFQESFEITIEKIKSKFMNIRIITPDGIKSGVHKIPSGSGFTNEIGSLAQVAAAIDSGCLFGNDTKIRINDFQVQGDDGVYLIKTDDYKRFIDAFSWYNLVVNESKSYSSPRYAIYLQNLYDNDYKVDGIIRGIYPTYRALCRIIFQERWSDFEDFGIEGRDYYSIRTICILENCKYHPLFNELVTYVYKLDKYSLEFKDSSLSKYIQMLGKSEGAGEILRHQYGDNVSGLRSFETVKLIRKLELGK